MNNLKLINPETGQKVIMKMMKKIILFLGLILAPLLSQATTLNLTIDSYVDTVNLPFVQSNYQIHAFCAALPATAPYPDVGNIAVPSSVPLVVNVPATVGSQVSCYVEAFYVPGNVFSLPSNTVSTTATAGIPTAPSNLKAQ